MLSVESGPGLANSQDDDSLSLCLHAHAGLSFLGLWFSKALTSSNACVVSLACVILPLVSLGAEPLPIPSSGTLKTSPTSLSNYAAASLSSLVKLSQVLLILSPSLHPELKTILHLVSLSAP